MTKEAITKLNEVVELVTKLRIDLINYPYLEEKGYNIEMKICKAIDILTLQQVEPTEAKDKQYLYDMYNATSTDDGTGNDELETYENWLERQLLSRFKTIVQLQQQLSEANEKLKEMEKENSELKDKLSWLTPRRTC